LMPSFERNLLTQRHEICSQETRDSRLSYGENPESLSYLGLNRYLVMADGQTDGQTDRITTANTRSAAPADGSRKLLFTDRHLQISNGGDMGAQNFVFFPINSSKWGLQLRIWYFYGKLKCVGGGRQFPPRPPPRCDATDLQYWLMG